MRRARGFTLIELLVVMVIIGTLVSLAVLSTGTPGGSRELRDEAERLAALIGVLADEAVLDGREYGLLLEDASYRVLAYDGTSGRWHPLESQPEHRLPAWAGFELALDGEALQLPVPETKDGASAAAGHGADEDKERLEPQLLILSSGELSAFRLRLLERRKGGNAFLLASDGYQLPSVALPGEGQR